MIDGAQIVAAARAWIGTPYHHQASLRGVGADCIGFIRGVARDVGLTDPFLTGAANEFSGYSTNPHPALMRAASRFMDAIASPDLGDVLVMRFKLEPQHFALLSAKNPDYLIHSYAGVGKVAEHRIDELWRRRILCAFRLRRT